MTKAALREQRRTQRIARRNRQRIIIGVIVALAVILLAFFVFQDYTSRNQSSTSGTLDATPPAPSANAITTASGLVYEDLQVGEGPAAAVGDTVSVDYTGWLDDGTKFDSSLDSGQPIEVTLGAGGVIPGWEEGLLGMQPNGIRLLIIPPELAYGASGSGPIPPDATLTFEVQLLEIK